MKSKWFLSLSLIMVLGLTLSNGYAAEKINISHNITLFPQPTGMSCWAAAASMVFGNKCVSKGDASTDKIGGLKSDYKNSEAFGKSHGLKIEAFQSFSVQGLSELLRKSPNTVIINR